ncbi:MAG: sulfite exporter TauE/SafE family protein [Clostridiales bacterium]|nr:sulfite exporter TauE/SafE family protein [Clostridiales bacterium]
MTAQHIIIAVSALGGIIGGMGMGGGTLLIPLLTLAAGVEQHLAQAINLIAFVPMSVVALIIHKKNGYVEIKQSIPIVALALGGAVGGSFLAEYAGGYVLRACYGAFLIVLGVIQIYRTVKTVLRNKKNKSERARGNMPDRTAKGA